MLRPKLYQRLDELGLGHLADQDVTFYSYGDTLHDRHRCRFAGEWGPPDDTLPPVVHVRIRDVDQRVCRCVNGSRNGALGPLREALELTLGVPRKWSAPEGDDPATLLQVAARVVQLESAVESLWWTSTTTPEVNEARGRIQDELRREIALHLERLSRSGPSAALLREATDRATWGAGVGTFHVTLKRVVGAHHSVELMEDWTAMVEAGLDRETRRRRLSRRIGTLLVREGNPWGLLREKVLNALEGVDVLEANLEAELASSGPPTLLAVKAGGNASDVYHRMLLAAFSVAERSGSHLLVAPSSIVNRFVAMDLTRTRALDTAVAPADPTHLENAVALWDPTSESTLATTRGAVEVAALV